MSARVLLQREVWRSFHANAVGSTMDIGTLNCLEFVFVQQR